MGTLRVGRRSVPHNGGLAQANLHFPPAYYDNWAINACKIQGNDWVGTSASDTDWPSLINDRGYPQAMPNGGGAFWASSQLYIDGPAGTVWTLDWEGTATFTLTSSVGGSISSATISSNEMEFTLGSGMANAIDGQPSNSWLVSLRITAMSTPVNNIRLYKTAHKSLINGSGITSKITPESLARFAGVGSIRFMDWAHCNANRTAKLADQNTIDDYKWAGAKTKASWFFGTATDSAGLNRWLLPNTLPTLTDGQIVQFVMPARPTRLNPTTVTKGAVTTFDFPAPHGLTTGEFIYSDFDTVSGGFIAAMADRSASTGLPPKFAVTVTNSTQFTIALNSTGFSGPTGGTFSVFPVFTISDGVQTKDVYSHLMLSYFNSAWGATYPRLISAVYSSDFGCFMMNGNNSGDVITTGVPIEIMVELCNHLRCNPYFNFPYLSEDAAWTYWATVARDTLLLSLTPRWSPGNEIWNTGNSFYATRIAESNSARLYGSLSSNLDYGRKFKAVQQLVHSVFGAIRPYTMVLEGQAVNGLPTTRIEGNATINGGSSAGYPINFADEVAYGPYIYPPFTFSTVINTYPGFLDAIDDWVTGNDISGAFNWLLNELISPTSPSFGNVDQSLDGYISVQHPKWSTAAASYTGRQGIIRVNHYEGGNGIAGYGALTRGGLPANATSGNSITATNVTNFYLAFLRSAQAATFMRQYLTRMKNAGVVNPSQYTLVSLWSAGATWGAQEMNDVAGAVSSPTLQFTEFKNWNNGL